MESTLSGREEGESFPPTPFPASIRSTLTRPKQPFNEKADADLVRYQKEYKATYGVETQSETLATKRLAAASKA